MHAYTSLGGGRTQFLSELESGSQVLVADAHGKTRTVLVGRVQIESKPLVLLVVEVCLSSYFKPPSSSAFDLPTIKILLFEVPVHKSNLFPPNRLKERVTV